MISLNLYTYTVYILTENSSIIKMLFIIAWKSVVYVLVYLHIKVF